MSHPAPTISVSIFTPCKDSKSVLTFSSFAPRVVWRLSDKDIEELGSEDDKTVKQRAELDKKLKVLEKGLTDLDKFSMPSVTASS